MNELKEIRFKIKIKTCSKKKHMFMKKYKNYDIIIDTEHLSLYKSFKKILKLIYVSK